MYNLLCPGESGGFYREVVSFVAGPEPLAEYDWSKLVLDKLVFGIKAAQALALREMSGYVALLLVSSMSLNSPHLTTLHHKFDSSNDYN